MLFEVFVWGSLWFWLLPVAFIIAVACFFENENSTGAIISFILFALAVLFLTDVPVISWLNENTYLALCTVAGYFTGIGLWMWIKWEFYTSKKMRKLAEVKEEFCKENGIDKSNAIPSNFEKDWNSTVKQYFGYKELPLKAKEHKALLVAWGINWPISFVWTLINDPVVQFTKFVYRHLGNYFDKRSKSKYDKVMGN